MSAPVEDNDVVTLDAEGNGIFATMLAQATRFVYLWDRADPLPVATPSTRLRRYDATSWHPTTPSHTTRLVYITLPSSPDPEDWDDYYAHVDEALTALAEEPTPDHIRARSPVVALVFDVTQWSGTIPQRAMAISTALCLALCHMVRLTIGAVPSEKARDKETPEVTWARRHLILEGTVQGNQADTIMAVYVRVHAVRKRADTAQRRERHLSPDIIDQIRMYKTIRKRPVAPVSVEQLDDDDSTVSSVPDIAAAAAADDDDAVAPDSTTQ